MHLLSDEMEESVVASVVHCARELQRRVEGRATVRGETTGAGARVQWRRWEDGGRRG
jgi:hypothetical protein